MNWLTKIEPIHLSQSSDIPYVILEDGVKLCFDNIYSENHDSNEHSIRFIAHKHDIVRKSADCWRFKQFPVTIPFKEVISLDDVVIDGRIIKTATSPSSETKSIVIVRSKLLNHIDDDEFQGMVDSIEEYDHAFLLTGSELENYDRLLADSMNIIHHRGWHYSCTSIANHLCKRPRKYCWTKTLPELSVTVYGIEEVDDPETIKSCFEDIGLAETEIIWV